jgi:hypothetical protein
MSFKDVSSLYSDNDKNPTKTLFGQSEQLNGKVDTTKL